MKLSPNFELDEFVRSSTAARLGIDNTPPRLVVEHLGHTALAMEQVRALLGAPVHVDSGYRSPALNAAVKGSASSEHLTGDAVDFVCPGFGTPLQIVKAIEASPIQFNQLIQEGSWVHISFGAAMKRQVLTAHFGPNGATYTEGA